MESADIQYTTAIYRNMMHGCVKSVLGVFSFENHVIKTDRYFNYEETCGIQNIYVNRSAVKCIHSPCIQCEINYFPIRMSDNNQRMQTCYIIMVTTRTFFSHTC